MTIKTFWKWLVIVAIILWIAYFAFGSNNVPAKEEKSEKEIFLEKRTMVWVYKYEEQEAERIRLEAKAKKDALLSELNWSDFTK